jgi:hypothetical protein
MRFPLVLCLVFLVAACGRGGIDPRLTVSSRLIERSQTPLLFAEVPEIRGGGVLRPSGANGDVLTWQTPDNRSFSFQNGVLVGTRGLGFDLMSADVSGTLAALSGATGQYELFHSTLDGDNKTDFRSFTCAMEAPVAEVIDVFGTVRATMRYDETCHAFGLSIENSYWIGDGVVWKARQWISEGLGYLITEQLVL